jgi:hypothetical protein
MAVGLYSGVSGLALGTGLYRNVSGLWGGSPGLISGFGGSNPFGGASLYLDFLSGSLDSRVSFSRGTNATMVDSTGRIVYAPANLLTYSQSFDNGVWAKNNISIVSGVSDPFGGTSAFTVTASGVSGSLQQAPTVVAGVAMVSSMWVRRRTGTGTISLRCGDAAPVYPIPVTSSWTRFSAAAVPTTTTGRMAVVLATVGDEVDVYGAQLEPVTYQTTPGPYVATTASAYYGPRFDYNPLTLGALGLLIEEQRTNLVTYSEQFDNAVWVKSNSSITANATDAPDGTLTADRLVEDTATSGHSVLQTISKSAAVATFTYSVYVKAAGRTAVQLRIADAVSSANRVICDANLSAQTVSTSVGGTFTSPVAAITALANGWFRVTLTGTTSTETSISAITFLANPSGTISYTGDGVSGAFLWGAQLEVGAFATSYIPTVASQVTRNADAASMTGTNFFGWYNQTEGTFVADYDVLTVLGGVKALVIASDGTTSERIYSYVNSAIPTLLVTDNGVTQATLPTTDIPANTTAKLAFAYALNDIAVSSNAGTVGVDTSATIPAANQLGVGSFVPSGSYLNGHIRQIAYFNTRLPNAQLETLSSPSLVPTLALDFTASSYASGY